jgi:hypothetical protein
MDDQTPAEVLPSLYREVLETVTRLEHAGHREVALEIRRKALQAYSTRWDTRGRRTLEKLNREAHHALASKRPVTSTALNAGTEPA